MLLMKKIITTFNRFTTKPLEIGTYTQKKYFKLIRLPKICIKHSI